MNTLPVVPFTGLTADSLGNYLASLGMLSLVAREWPTVRAVWRDATFCLVGGPATLEQTVQFVDEVGSKSTWTKYDKPWDRAKKADIAASRKGADRITSRQTAIWRSLEADEGSMRLFGAHLALDGRVRMNPLLGTGGNAGRRAFDRGWRNAVRCIENPPGRQSRESLAADLRSFLSGQACTYLGDFSAGSWFGNANKTYNHGTRRPYREGEITPWAMALACEGLPYFAGAPSRHMGSRQQPKGAFPFVTTGVAPESPGEAGRIEAEIWAPVWQLPITEPELRALFLRGRAELGGKAPTSSGSFVAGIIARGVDAGIAEFRRFLLIHTTSAQTFESRMASIVPVPKANPDGATVTTIQAIVELCHALPADRKLGKRWQFRGLRGPLERALVDFAAAYEVGDGNEQAWALVDEMIGALARVDRNRTFRGLNVRLRLLPAEWAAQRFRHEPPDRETRLALAVSSLLGTPASPRFIEYRIGVENEGQAAHWRFPDSAPTRRVWNDGDLTENLAAVAERRVMETSRTEASRSPFRAAVRVDVEDLLGWLSGSVDEGRMRLWLDRLCVFDWSAQATGSSRVAQPQLGNPRPTVDGTLALYALFRPLASDWLFGQILRQSGIDVENASTCAHLGRVLAMLRRGDVNAAAEVALDAYRAVGVPLADFDILPTGCSPSRMLAALMIPVRDGQLLAVFQRWRSPEFETD